MQKLRIILLFLFISSIILIGCDIKEKEYEYEEITVNVITGEYNLPGILTLPISNKKYLLLFLCMVVEPMICMKQLEN